MARILIRKKRVNKIDIYLKYFVNKCFLLTYPVLVNIVVCLFYSKIMISICSMFPDSFLRDHPVESNSHPLRCGTGWVGLFTGGLPFLFFILILISILLIPGPGKRWETVAS